MLNTCIFRKILRKEISSFIEACSGLVAPKLGCQGCLHQGLQGLHRDSLRCSSRVRLQGCFLEFKPLIKLDFCLQMIHMLGTSTKLAHAPHSAKALPLVCLELNAPIRRLRISTSTAWEALMALAHTTAQPPMSTLLEQTTPWLA